MTPKDLLDLLHAVLRGEAPPERLFDLLDQARLRAPQACAALLPEIDRLHERNELHFDLYLQIKDRLYAGTPARSKPLPPDDAATRVRASPLEPTDRTMLRSSRDPASGAVRAEETLAVPMGPATPSPHAASVTGARAGPSASGTSESGSETFETPTLVIEPTLEPGMVVKDRYVLEERLGEGGMGVVFKARDRLWEEARDRNPYVAIKFLNAEFRRHPSAFMALQRETSRAAKLAHPNIINVHHFDRDGTLLFMTMEFLEGQPLDHFILQHPQGLRFKEAWPIIEGCARALAYAHEERVIHADFKPGNVFVASGRKVKVLDFGIARARVGQGDDRSTGTRFDGRSLGALTPAYASPEMLLNEPADTRDDVYALACVAYEVLTGRHPFDGAEAVKAEHDGMTVKRTPGMGRRQHRALVRGLAFRQADRSPSVEAFLDEIAGPFGARGLALRQSLLFTAVTLALFTAIAVGAWWFMHASPDEQLMREQMERARAQAQIELEKSGNAPEVDAVLRDTLLEQGRDYLQLAAQTFDVGLLSEGISSAYGAFSNALEIDPSSTAAAEGIVQIVRAYEAEAQRALERGDAARASELAGYALKIHPTRDSMLELKKKADAAAKPTAP